MVLYCFCSASNVLKESEAGRGPLKSAPTAKAAASEVRTSFVIIRVSKKQEAAMVSARSTMMRAAARGARSIWANASMAGGRRLFPAAWVARGNVGGKRGRESESNAPRNQGATQKEPLFTR